MHCYSSLRMGYVNVILFSSFFQIFFTTSFFQTRLFCTANILYYIIAILLLYGNGKHLFELVILTNSNILQVTVAAVSKTANNTPEYNIHAVEVAVRMRL